MTAEKKPLKIYKTYYANPNYDPIEHGPAVKASNGAPRFGTKYPLLYAAPEIYPPWALVKDPAPWTETIPKYQSVLDTRGVEAIRKELEDIAASAGVDKLTIMCFEKDPGDCHRTAFADWWEEHTGEVIEEIPPKTPVRRASTVAAPRKTL